MIETEELLDDITKSDCEVLSVFPDLSHLAVSLSSRHVLLVSLPDYFQVDTLNFQIKHKWVMCFTFHVHDATVMMP